MSFSGFSANSRFAHLVASRDSLCGLVARFRVGPAALFRRDGEAVVVTRHFEPGGAEFAAILGLLRERRPYEWPLGLWPECEREAVRRAAVPLTGDLRADGSNYFLGRARAAAPDHAEG